MLKNTVIFFFGPFIIFVAINAFFLYRICRCFVEIKDTRWAKALLFVTMLLTSGTVVWIGDNNFAMTFPFYIAAFLFSTKGDSLGRLTVGGILFCFIMAVCAISNTYMIPSDKYGWYDFTSRGVRPVIFGVIYLLFRKQLKKETIQLPHRLWKLCAGLTILPFVTLSVLILPTYWMPESMLLHNLTLFQGLFILPLSLIVSVVLLQSIIVLADYEKKAQAAALADMREVYYQSLQREQTQVRTLRHDLRNHLNVISGLLDRGETNKAQDYLTELEASSALDRSERICENEIVNVVLASKNEDIKQQGIKADFQISLPARLPISDTDLCALFGNALDNAIEAAQKSEEKNIILRCKAECGIFMLRLENSLAGDEHEDLSTTKKDKAHHGFGLAGMREIASQYNGILDAQVKENKFELIVSIPLEQAE